MNLKRNSKSPFYFEKKTGLIHRLFSALTKKNGMSFDKVLKTCHLFLFKYRIRMNMFRDYSYHAKI